MADTTSKRLHPLPHYVERTLQQRRPYGYGSLLSGLGRVMTTVEASGETIKASTVLSFVFALMLTGTTGMVSWLFINTVTHGEVIERLESHQQGQDARLTELEKRIDRLLAEHSQSRP